MESWRRVWRDGLVPQLSTASLENLREGLARDDHRLVQQATTCPPCLEVFADSEVEGACALGYCGWQGEGLTTVGAIEGFFADMCSVADERLGEPGECRHFLSWFDETPREAMRRELLAEVTLALNERYPLRRRRRSVAAHVSAA